MTTVPFPAATITGYPRIGRRRELKKALEAYWAGRSTREELESAAADLQLATHRRLVELGLGARDSSLPAAFPLYDQVLDTTVALGAVPARFAAAYARASALRRCRSASISVMRARRS